MKKNKVIVIAEAGVNHNGDLDMARQLISVAADAGADYVKFQTYKTENLVSPTAEQASYQKENTGGNETQFQMLKRLELKYEDHYELKEFALKKGIKFLSTAFDDDSIDFLFGLGIDFYKIPSGEITNYFYLRNVARKGLPIVLSTGMSNLQDIQSALDVLMEFGIDKKNITVLHCNSQYPSPVEDLNLTAMLTIKNKFNVAVGYSDHSAGIEVSIAAVAMGATVIEKHFTLDRNLPGPDHKASLEPEELKKYVEQVRLTEKMLGNGIKEPSESEKVNLIPGRKSLVAKTDLNPGHILTIDDLSVKRPGDGICPTKAESLVGKKIKNKIIKDQQILMKDFES